MELLQTTEQATLDTAQPATAVVDTPQEQVPGQPDFQTLSPQELVDHLAVLLQQDELPDRKLVDSIRGQFVRRRARLSTEDKALIESFEVQELRLEGLIASFKVQDKKRQEELALLYQENKEKKEVIVSRLERLIQSHQPDATFESIYTPFCSLRDEWGAITKLDPKDAAQLNKRFYELRDQFYDLDATQDEQRDLDFQKHLESKQAIIAELRLLPEVKDTVLAYRRLIELSDQWSEIGPVAKELRQELRSEFKQLSTAQFKRHQDYHDRKRATEEENLQAKERLCQQVEELLEAGQFNSHKAFAKGVEQIKALQEEWRKIGRVHSRTSNEEIYLRFRAAIDAFFRLRSEFSKEKHSQQGAIIEKKRELIQRAQALRESTDWDATAEALKKLQLEWQEAGNLSHHQQNQKLWEEFRESFNYFFNRKKKEAPRHRHNPAYAQAEQNSKARRELLAQIETLTQGEAPADLATQLQSYKEKWRQIGTALHRDREELQATYRRLLDQLHGKLRQHRSSRQLADYSASLEKLAEGTEDGLQGEMRHLSRQLTHLKSKLQTYEANLSRINAKEGSPLLSELQRNREGLVSAIEITEKKLALLKERATKED